MDATRACKTCKGTGKVDRCYCADGRRCYHHERGIDPVESCNSCKGAGNFSAPDITAIIAEITVTRGSGKGRLKKSMNSFKATARGYFVWRLARFHGGADMRMPMVAEWGMHGDPFEPELNKIAELVAKRAFGTDMAATAAWGRALGFMSQETERKLETTTEGQLALGRADNTPNGFDCQGFEGE